MIRVQIQLGEDLHARAKRLAAAREISLAELARRGIELFLAQTPSPDELAELWRAPTVDLGWKGMSHAQIKDEARRTRLEEELEERARTPSRV